MSSSPNGPPVAYANITKTKGSSAALRTTARVAFFLSALSEMFSAPWRLRMPKSVSRVSYLAWGIEPANAASLSARETATVRISCTLWACDAKMHHMKKATVRDLRYRFSVVEDLLRDGEEIHITKRKRVIARLLPPKPAKRVRRPDFLARMKKIFGKKRMKISGAEIIALDREERF